MKKHLVRYLLGAACVLLFVGHGAKFWQLPFFSVLDGYLYDVRVRMSTPGGKDERIVIVDLDEKSLAEIGRWPWGRDVVSVQALMAFLHAWSCETKSTDGA